MKKVLVFAALFVLISASVCSAQTFGPAQQQQFQRDFNQQQFQQQQLLNQQQQNMLLQEQNRLMRQQQQFPNGYIPSSELKLFHVAPNRNGENVY